MPMGLGPSGYPGVTSDGLDGLTVAGVVTSLTSLDSIYVNATDVNATNVTATNDVNANDVNASYVDSLDANISGTLQATTIRIGSNPPATADASGNAGDVTWDADYIYVCIALNTWKRVAIATW